MMNDPMHNNQLEDTHTLSSFQGKAIVSQDTGRKIGTVEDVLIDPGEMRIDGIVTSKGGFLRQSVNAIKSEDIVLWGEDVVLVNRNDVARKKEELPGLEECLSAYDNIYDRDVISLEGDRLGKMEDLLITPHGQLAGISINRISSGLADLLKGEKKDIHRLPISTLHSFGKDVMIIDLDRVREFAPAAPTTEEFATESRMDEPNFVPATGKKDADEFPEDDDSRNNILG